MQPIAPSKASQWKLPLIDLNTLAIPEQKELTQALMDLLIQVGQQLSPSTTQTIKEDLDADF